MATSPKITIAGNQRFACIQCGQCCRRWHVALSGKDILTLRNLDWRQEPEAPDDFVTIIDGNPYVAHRPNGECVFLDPETNLCRIHRRWGADAKPLGCRVYPLNITPAFWGEVCVTARMDCPAVQRNVGPPLNHRRRDIEKYARLLQIPGGFSQEDLDGLSPAAVDSVLGALVQGIVGATGIATAVRSRALLLATEQLQEFGTAFLNDTSTLDEVLPQFLTRVLQQAQRPAGPPVGAFSRAYFRQWLAAYLRRDEEVISKDMMSRANRTWVLMLILWGRGAFRPLGTEHPDVPLAKAGLFCGKTPAAGAAPGSTPPDNVVWECYWRMMTARIEARQFFGAAYYGLPLFTGLRALVQTYALVRAAAQCRAAAHAAASIGPADVHYAVGAVDHSYGRSRLLQMRWWRATEIYFSGTRYARLLGTLT